MATTLPAKLKIPTIQPFAVRAAQLEHVAPVISHWCRYYMVQTIITKGLHEADDECRDYTSQIMDKLEETKSQTPTNELTLPNDAAQAYVEKFALDTFNRADDSIHTDRASRQTVETFQAASNFLELLTVFGPIDTETHAKIKYAKYHALRIVKAMRAGEDPNASNPKPDVVESQQEPSVVNQATLPDPSATYQPPTVESAPDSMQPSRIPSTVQFTPLAPPPLSPTFDPPTSTISTDVSPLASNDSPEQRPSTSTGSTGPDTTCDASVKHDVESFYSQMAGAAQPSTRPPPSYDTPAPVTQSIPRPVASSYTSPARSPAPLTTAPAASATGYRTDDEAIANAQKHAKWAISALQFEDANTAVKELRIALQALGAS